MLTSSKCLDKIGGIKKIKAGAENLQIPEKGRYVETYQVERNESSETNDLAYVYTTKDMHFNPKTQPICLPQATTAENPKGDFVTFQQGGYQSKYVSNNKVLHR